MTAGRVVCGFLIFWLGAEASAQKPEVRSQKAEWLGSGVRSGPDGEVFHEVVSGRYPTEPEAMADALRQAASLAQKQLQKDLSRGEIAWEVPIRFVQDVLLQDCHVQQVPWRYEAEYGPIYQAHLLVRLTPETRSALKHLWQQELVSQRLRRLGMGFGCVLIGLVSVLGYLRLNEALRGRYRGRLKLAALAVAGFCTTAVVLLLS